MAYGLNDRVREQVSAFAGGTGAVTLPVVAVTGSQTFLSGWGASGTGEYCIAIGAQWETGFGTLNAGGTTLTRTTTYNGSSGLGVAVNFSAGTMDCFGDMPAELLQHLNMREITVASAATCDIGAVAGSNIIVSGAVTITSLGTKANRRRYVRFSGALTLTHNGTSLILPGATNIVTVAGDTAIFQSDASGNWRCVEYGRASNLPIVNIPPPQKFTSGGTYTPTVGMIFCIIECQGAGGGGGGTKGGGANFYAGAGGGGSGGYSRKYASSATIGTSQTITIGAAGTAGAATPTDGGAGGDTSVGVLCVGKGGSGGGANNAGGGTVVGGVGGIAGTGDVTATGQAGFNAPFNAGSTFNAAVNGGAGAPAQFGGGGVAPRVVTGATAGNAGTGFGSGGSGATSGDTTSTAAGGAGAAGLVIITEFCTK